MSNVHPLLPKLTVNRPFIYDFIAADAPCFALGLVEERKQQSGLLALRPGEVIPSEVTSAGFNFGHSLLGTADVEVIHFAFEFYGFGTYNVLLNPSNPLVQAVLRTMIESGGYFFFAIGPDQSVTAFQSEIGQQDLAGLKMNLQRILGSSTTEAQYNKALAQFQRRPEPPGRLLTWVCRDNVGCLDLTHDRLEISPSPDTAKTAPRRGHATAKSTQEPHWQPLSMLPTIAMIIDEELAGAEEQRVSLLDARERPHVLDDDIVHRVTRLYTDQLEFVPIHREQIARWRAASLTLAQRNEIARLSGQLDRHEGVLKEVLALAKKLELGTIDAILRMDEGELGLAVFDGRIKPPDGAPPSAALRVREQRAIAKVLDASVEELEEKEINPVELLAHMAPQMPLFKRLMDISDEGELSDLCEEYPGLYRLAKLLELVAAGVRSDGIEVPR